MSMFSPEEARRVSDAIAEAERKTSGEIVVVVAARSDAYLYVPPLIAALIALIVPWPLIFLTRLNVETIFLIQLAVFLVFTALLMPESVRTALVPAAIRRRHAHQRAIEQFLVQNLYRTAEHTGVLIFVSAAEHYVEVLADAKIDSRAPPGAWQAIVDDLTTALAKGEAAAGLAGAVTAVGAHLARHFPPGTRNLNELPDHLIVLE
jgi:putative membrane protein